MASGDKFYLTSQPAERHYTHNATATTTETVITLPFEISKFNYIANDGTQNLLVAFNNKTTADSQNGMDGVIVLSAGEVLNDFSRKANSVKVKAATGTVSFRFLGV